MMEFHISRSARDRYGFRETLFSLTGNVVFASLSASREFAHRMNQVRATGQYRRAPYSPRSSTRWG